MSTHAPPPHDAPAGPAPGLTASERRIWTGQRLDPAAPLYNMALAITIEGALDVPRFQRAFARLVEETDALRTTFPERNGQPERQVHASPSGTLDIEHWPLAQVDDDAVAQRLAARTRRLFDVATGPLFDSVLVRRAPDLHVWYLNQHHLITDAWSVGVLHRRLGALYEADGAPLPDAPPFADFVQYERGLRDAPPLLRARAHWGDRAAPRALGLYGDTRPGSGRTRRVRVPLGAQRAEHLARLAASPPFRSLSPEQSRFLAVATVLAAWIHRVADTRDVALGTPWHNRITPRQRETAGLFIELYPVRLHVQEGETFTSLARTLGASTLETLRHVVPGASAAPGAHDFAVVLNAITARMGPFAGRPTRAEWIHAGAGDPAHRLRVQVHDFDAQGEPVIDFDLDERTFGPREREWAVRHFLALFDALAADDTALVAAVPLVSADEEAVFAAPVVETEPAPTVPAQIAEQIRARPHAVAVRDGDVRLTYGTLAERARALGAALQAAGVEPGDVVGVCLERSAALIVALLGVWEAGAAWLPLDPAHPEPRRAALLEDARARAVVTSDVLAPSLRALDRPVLTVDREGRTDAPGGASQPGAPAPGRAHLAYVLYTSGSTGTPKGVEVEHGALADYVRWARDVYTDGEPLAFALFTSPAFDLTLTSIFTPLVAGGAVVVYRDAVHSGLLVRRVLEDDAVDVVKLTPSHLALLRDLDLRTARVRRLILGGEDLKGPLAAAVHDAFGGAVEILNEYGPTEATVGCMLHRFDRERDARGSVPIGRPAPDVRLRVLDAWGRPVPRGVIGELWIGGRRLARGYRGDAARTAERFVADASEPKLRFYRTGDRARWRPDGALDFLGRNDDQLKVRGVRIERAEVEAALLGHPDVHEAVAHLVRSGPSDVTCVRCGLEAAHPEALLDDQQVCAVCRRFERERAQVAGYFGTLDDLRGLLAEARAATEGPHDCLMLYSGGKDSTYALCRVVEMGARPLVFLLDNGFISDQAKANVRRVVDLLGLELVVGSTPAMPAIFADSLARHSNVCNGCFKTIYTLALQLAHERGLRHIVTGLSRGQIFETRLHDLFRRGIYAPADVDHTILEARKAYHRMDDAVRRELDAGIFETDEVLEQVRFVDFYRYCDDTLEQILAYVAEHTPWIRPSDTGRSTNCLINEAGIWVHKTERGFHNYAMPYSWDVRLGHKEREAALEELDDDLDPGRVREMLDAVGYRVRPPAEAEARLVAYYTAAQPLPADVLRDFLERTLPGEMVPSAFVRLDRLPLTPNGKVDLDALPRPDAQRPVLDGVYVAPRTEVEHTVCAIWQDVLGLEAIGVHDDFFALGGDSMQCIQIVAAARRAGLELQPHHVFEHPTVAALAGLAARSTHGPQPTVARAGADELAELLDEFGE